MVRFFKKHRVRVGISCDGPAILHDLNRRRWNNQATHQDVLVALDLLHEWNVDWGVLATVTPETLRNPDGFLEFFLEQGVSFLGMNFIRRIAAHEQELLGQDLARTENFLRRLFDLYMKQRAANPGSYMRIREFEDILQRMLWDHVPFLPDAPKNPFQMLNIDAFGNFSTYDPLLLTAKTTAYPDNNFIVGNIFTDDLEKVIASEKFQKIYADVSEGVERCKASCDYFKLCNACHPAAKQGEHGTFLSTETVQCVIDTKIIANIALTHLQQDLQVKEEHRKSSEVFAKSMQMFSSHDLVTKAESRILPRILLFPMEEKSSVEVLLSKGTESEYEPIQNALIYKPKGGWSKPLDSEIPLLWADPALLFDPSASIGICRLPVFLKNMLLEAREQAENAFDLSSDTHPAALYHCHPAMRKALQALEKWVKSQFIKPERWAEQSRPAIGIHMPGLSTTTRDYHCYSPQAPRTGLHVDYWQRMPIHLSGQAYNRLVFNIGSENRHFLFLNLPITDLLTYLGKEERAILLSKPPTELAKQFMEHYPDYPVVRVTLAPGQGYLAPTESMIHDATTLENSRLDCTVTFLGHFNLSG